ncbi:winged helix-turn-helix transcriptional regulator [Vibrio coralliilyticus]|nr:winged helix-turn-helix transcriptional regulator [Vibrio coralliilyticus]
MEVVQKKARINSRSVSETIGLITATCNRQVKVM